MKHIVALLALISLVACNQQALQVESCIIISELNIGFCIDTVTRAERDLPLTQMNKYTCFSPEDWGKIRLSLREQTRRKRQLDQEFDKLLPWQSHKDLDPLELRPISNLNSY